MPTARAAKPLGHNARTDDLLRFLHACHEVDCHAYADVIYRFGGDALLDSHLPMLDLTDRLAPTTRRSSPWIHGDPGWSAQSA